MSPDTRPDPLATLLHETLNDDRPCVHSPENEWEPLCEELAHRAGVTLTQPDAGLRKAAQPFLEAALNVFPEDWISPGSSYAIAITVRGSEVDALRAALRSALRSTPAAPKEDDRE